MSGLWQPKWILLSPLNNDLRTRLDLGYTDYPQLELLDCSTYIKRRTSGISERIACGNDRKVVKVLKLLSKTSFSESNRLVYACDTCGLRQKTCDMRTKGFAGIFSTRCSSRNKKRQNNNAAVCQNIFY